VKSLFRSRTANRKATLEDLIGGYELSPFPGAILKAMEVIREEASSLEEIAEALRGDPALSVRVLQLVNSASFGLRRAVDDLAQAVHMIGRSSLESLLISIGVRRALPGGRCSGYDPRRFWQTAARRAATARALAQELEPARRSRAFTAAFLQDIAVTLLVDRMPEEYGAVLTRWHAEGVPLHELEREAFGWDHAVVGAAMCEEWALPADLAHEIGGHHASPEDADAASKPVLLSAFLRESEEDPGTEALLEFAASHYDMRPEPLVALLDKSFEAAEEVAAALA
jgi:HD-like signal output (HDOD) protein